MAPFDEQRIGAGNYLLNTRVVDPVRISFSLLKPESHYNLIKIYGEEKFKPGKRSKLASLKEKEGSQDKPGFFSRLKFKRK